MPAWRPFELHIPRRFPKEGNVIEPTVGFIIYGVHKDGLKDPMGQPFIDDAVVAKSEKALTQAGIKLVRHQVVVATKEEAITALRRMKNDPEIDAVVLFSGTWVWSAHLVGAVRDFAATGKGVLLWTHPGSQGWRPVGGLVMRGGLLEIGVAHKFVYGAADDALTVDKITAYARAACLKNWLNLSTIGTFGGRGMGQTCGVADPSQWMRMFGIDIDSRDTTELIRAAESVSREKIAALGPRLAKLFGAAPEPSVVNERSIRLYLGLREVVERERFDFYTVQSFPGYGDLQHIHVQKKEIKIIGDGACPPSLACKLGPAGFAEHGIPTEGEAGGLSVKLICKVGEGVLARLGRVNGEFQMAITRATVFETPAAQIKARLNECGIPFWPHGFVTAHCDIEHLLQHWTNEYACLGYGPHLYFALIDFCEMTGIKAVPL